MANKIKEIKEFFSGIISSFSSSDIKDDSASFSLNIDSSEKDGVLKGAKKESDLISAIEIDTNVSKVIESEDNKFDLAYADAESGNIQIINDVYGSRSVSTPDGASGVAGSAQSMEVKNDKVYIGHGKSIPPKILYRTKKTPFQKESDTLSNWIYENSTVYDKNLLNSSFSVDRFINFPGAGIKNATHTSYTSGIGIRYDHKDLYYIDYDGLWNDTDNIFDLSGGNTKVHLGTANGGRDVVAGAACDLCQADVKNYANNVSLSNNNDIVASADFRIWVLSINHLQSESTSGVPQLQKFKITEEPGRNRASGSNSSYKGAATHEGTYLFEYENGETPPEGAIPGSVLETSNYLWIQYWKPSGDMFTRNENFLYCADLNDIPNNGGTIVFKNKSLNYDRIKKGRAKINYGNKHLTTRVYETYFYNSDMPWQSLKTGNWLRGDEDWGSKTSARGNHYYSGIYSIDGEPGFTPIRHGLIQSPLTDKEEPAINNDESEDWVGVLTTCDDQLINIYSAWSYRVAGGWNWHSYHKLRASDDSGQGSANEGGIWWWEWLRKFLNVIYFVFSGQAVIDYLAAWELGNIRRQGVFKYMGWLYGGEDLNWYYNGKCFETGILSTQLINISSNHKPSAKLNAENGARIHIRELYGFDTNLEIICVKHYMDRLMITCHDPGQEDKFMNTLFFMYNTSNQSVTENHKVQICILDHNDDKLDHEWRDGALIPDEYLSEGSSAVIKEGNHPNKIFQLYVPVTDLEEHNYGKYPELFADFDDQVTEIYPHLTPEFFAASDEVAFEMSQLWNKNLTGDIFYTEDAVFDIYRTGTNVFNGQKTIMPPQNGTYGIGYSHQPLDPDDSLGHTEGDHISFMSTAGPFNVSKFNFKIVTNDNSDAWVNEQLGLFTDSSGNSINHIIYEDDPIAILSLNQEPNQEPEKDYKQYALDAKSISFSVKAHPYDGLNIAPFIHNVDDGRELYRYKINLVYDGYQDSPLCTFFTQVDIRDLNVRHTGHWDTNASYKVGDQVRGLADGAYKDTVYTCIKAADSNDNEPHSETSHWEENNDYKCSALAVSINLHKPEIISRRVTHVRLWRSRCELNEDSVTGDDVYTIEQAYTLVDTIPLESNWNVTNEASTLYNSPTTDTTLGMVATFTAVDNGIEDVSFEAYTGMPEKMKVYQPNYTLSTQLLSYLFVADCKHPSFEDATNLIFRSQPDRYNTFDWTRDFVSIPSTPKAMTSFNGRIIVWDFNNMYVINPGNLYIEDTYEGTGCLDSTSFERTEFGICFADENNIYMFDGKEVKNIGIPIVTSHKQGLKISWKDRDREYPTHIKFEADKRCFCIFFRISGDSDYNWLLRAIKAQQYEEYIELDNPPLKWYEIPGADVNFSTGENPFRYIWHLDMWRNHFQDAEISSYDDYIYSVGDKNIRLPFGTGYDTEKGHYIVDLEDFCKSQNINGILNFYTEEQLSGNVLYVLQKDDYPNYANIITDGKFDMEHRPSHYFYTFNIDKKRWDLQETSKYKGVFNGPKGELYSSMITRGETVLDISRIDESDAKFFTHGTTPLGGRANIIEELNLFFQDLSHTIISDNITSMRAGPTNDGYKDYSGPIQGMQWYRQYYRESGLHDDNIYNNIEEYKYYIDMEITPEQGEEWSQESQDKFNDTFDMYDNLGGGILINLMKYDPNIGQRITAFETITGGVDEIKLYVGETADLYEGPAYEEWDVTSETVHDWIMHNVIDRLISAYTGETWNIPQFQLEAELEDFYNPDLPISTDNMEDDKYIEITCPNSINLSVGDKVIITETGWSPGTGNHYLGNNLGSPFKDGLVKEVYYIDGNKFRVKVSGSEEYFNTEEWDFRPGYLYNWWEELEYIGSDWPHPQHHGTAIWQRQEDWMLQISIGDLNRDGGINIQDISVAQDARYIVIQGKEFEDLKYYIDDSPYYPDIILIDPTSYNNYHRLAVIWCYPVEINPGQWVSYLLLQNQMYEDDSDTGLGWNTTSEYTESNHMPEGAMIILNDDSVVLPGEPGLKQMFGSEDSQQFVFISKNFSFENQTTNKILSKIKIIYQNTAPTFYYMINNNNQWIVPDSSKIVYEENCLYYQIPKEYKKAKSLKIKIMSNSSESNVYNYDTEVDSFSIIYRERGNA